MGKFKCFKKVKKKKKNVRNSMVVWCLGLCAFTAGPGSVPGQGT